MGSKNAQPGNSSPHRGWGAEGPSIGRAQPAALARGFVGRRGPPPTTVRGRPSPATTSSNTLDREATRSFRITKGRPMWSGLSQTGVLEVQIQQEGGACGSLGEEYLREGQHHDRRSRCGKGCEKFHDGSEIDDRDAPFKVHHRAILHGVQGREIRLANKGAAFFRRLQAVRIVDPYNREIRHQAGLSRAAGLSSPTRAPAPRSFPGKVGRGHWARRSNGFGPSDGPRSGTGAPIKGEGHGKGGHGEVHPSVGQ